MILTTKELAKVHRLRNLKPARTYQAIAKLLHRRKAVVLRDYKEYYNKPTKHLEYRYDRAQKLRPVGYRYERFDYTVAEAEAKRTKKYPSWAWQYWIEGIFSDGSETGVVLKGFSFNHATIEQPAMYNEAIVQVKGPQGYYDSKPWVLVEKLSDGYILHKLIKQHVSHPQKHRA